MVCPYCGTAVAEGTEVCPICKNVLPADGAPTSRLVPPLQAAGNVSPGPPGPPPANPYAAPPGGYTPPAPYPPPSVYAPPHAYPSPPASPYAPPATPYNMLPPGYTPATVAAPPRRGNPALLWTGVGLLVLSLALCSCLALVVLASGADATNTAADLREIQLGGALCALGVFFLLGVPGALLFFFGVRRQ